MKNSDLAQDYLLRSKKRLVALEALMGQEAWPDVVRESQEVVELALKALLRSMNIEFPRVHDVSQILMEHQSRFDQSKHKLIERFCKISKQLRRDRELAYYGSEDLTPSEFYKKEDAAEAQSYAIEVVEGVYSIVESL